VTATDAAGNPDPSPATRSFTVDTTGPTVTVEQAAGQVDPTNVSPVRFTVVFSEPVTGFDPADVVLGGTAGAVTAVVSGSGTTYTVAVSGMTRDGTVTAAVPQGAVSDAAGNASTASTSRDNTVGYASARTALLYTGQQIVAPGGNLALQATLSSAFPPCINDLSVTFLLDDNPIATVTTTSSGVAKTSVPTTGWPEGVYTLTARFAAQSVPVTGGTAACSASSDDATLTVAGPGQAATGGGWYTLSGSGRINFGMTVRQVPRTSPAQYKGQLLLINNGKWRLKGDLTSYSKTGTSGAASGTGSLYAYDPATGEYVLDRSGVSFTISFKDNGSGGRKSTPDTFGIHIDARPPTPSRRCRTLHRRRSREATSR
jgi:hypothetical protein